MRAILITLVLALVAVLAAAEVKAPVCPAPQGSSAAAPIAMADWARLQGLQVEPSPRSTDFPCPAIFSCGVNCSPSEGATYDTGEASCTGDGFAFHCAPGKTIHVTGGSCIRAYCCTHFPYCLCGPCSGWQTWTCA